MKTIFSIGFAMATLIFTFAQQNLGFDSKAGFISLEMVEDAQGTQEEIFSRAQKWITENAGEHFEDHRSIFMGFYEDKAKIELLPHVTLKRVVQKGKKEEVEYFKVRYKLKFWSKDGKMRVRVTELHTREGLENKPIEQQWLDENFGTTADGEAFMAQFMEKVTPMLKAFAEGTKKEVVVYNEDEW